MFDVEGKGWYWKNKKQNIDDINSEKEPSEKTIYNLLGILKTIESKKNDDRINILWNITDNVQIFQNGLWLLIFVEICW